MHREILNRRNRRLRVDHAQAPGGDLRREIARGQKRDAAPCGCEAREHVQAGALDDAVEVQAIRGQPIVHEMLQARTSGLGQDRNYTAAIARNWNVSLPRLR